MYRSIWLKIMRYKGRVILVGIPLVYVLNAIMYLSVNNHNTTKRDKHSPITLDRRLQATDNFSGKHFKEYDATQKQPHTALANETHVKNKTQLERIIQRVQFGDWQVIKDNLLYSYSAYYDSRFNRIVMPSVVDSKRAANRRMCVLWYEGQQQPVEVPALVKMLHETHGLK